MRLDVQLFSKGICESRDKGKEEILNGNVCVNGKVITKPSFNVCDQDKIELTSKTVKYVSRAGLKLEGAKDKWNINFKDKIILDVGASTGGFTDFAIQNDAKKVFAVDVGSGQLHKSLLNNEKVINFEQTDFRNFVKPNEQIDLIVCDCSFISLKLLAYKFAEILEINKELIVLIKPQFECGMKIAKKFKGIIKDKSLQEKIKNELVEFIENCGFKNVGVCDSPILGTQGNKEFLAYFVKI